MRILVIDDAEDTRLLVVHRLQAAGHELFEAPDGETGLERIAELDPDLVLVDLVLPGMNGIEIIEKVRRTNPGLTTILITAHGSVKTAVQALKAGAFDYLTKPLDFEEVFHAVQKVQEKIALVRENQLLRSRIERVQEREDYATQSEEVRTIIRQTEKVALTDATVLITGESGTGKEILAKHIQRTSRRADKPFVTVNCSALSEQLLESELFGHVRGAFTDAYQDHQGYFEVADQGTLFMDEIGDLSSRLQVKLLRVLQEKEFSRVGDTRVRPADVRIIAATNRDLKRLIEDGSMRQDFYYRINIFGVHLPPLRDRREDIVFLFEQFVQEFSAQMNKHISGIAAPVREVLEGYEWPGNIRELRNLAERMTILCEGEEMGRDLIPEELLEHDPGTGGSSDFKKSRREFEIRFITDHLVQNRGNVAATAKQIGMHPVALRQKVAKLGIDSRRIKDRFT